MPQPLHRPIQTSHPLTVTILQPSIPKYPFPDSRLYHDTTALTCIHARTRTGEGVYIWHIYIVYTPLSTYVYARFLSPVYFRKISFSPQPPALPSPTAFLHNIVYTLGSIYPSLLPPRRRQRSEFYG